MALLQYAPVAQERMHYIMFTILAASMVLLCILKIGYPMTHDDFCINPNQDEDTCIVCDLIARVRRDEQDVVQGDSELDTSEIKAQAFDEGYKRGYKEGQSSIVQQPIYTSHTTDEVKKYILANVTKFSLEQTNALYDLYRHIGGK